MSWPYPGDSPVARARRVAQAYRADLEAYAPERCGRLDSLMREWGQLWVIPRVVTYDPDAWLSAADAADLAAVSTNALRRLRERGRLTGRQVGPQRWEYRAADINALTTHKRPRSNENGTTRERP